MLQITSASPGVWSNYNPIGTSNQWKHLVCTIGRISASGEKLSLRGWGGWHGRSDPYFQHWSVLEAKFGIRSGRERGFLSRKVIVK